MSAGWIHENPFRLDNERIEEIQSPALLISLPRVRRNVAEMVALLGGDASRWRPHAKTAKVGAVYDELIGAGVHQFKCATTREAAVLAERFERVGSSGDVLVAYAHVQPALTRLDQIARRHRATRLSVLCESAADVAGVPSSLEIFIDVNSGMNRTGVDAVRRDEIFEIAARSGSRFRGLHCYEGHLVAAEPSREAVDARQIYERVVELASALRENGTPVREIVTSGTPSFPFALDFASFRDDANTIHRVSPGTIVYHDARSLEQRPELPFRPAACVFSRVISRPSAETATCDAGSKAIAAEAGDPCAVVLEHPELRCLTPSEEHLPLTGVTGDLVRGSGLYLVPRHVCPTVNLAQRAVLIEDGGEISIVDVAARAHELELRT